MSEEVYYESQKTIRSTCGNHLLRRRNCRDAWTCTDLFSKSVSNVSIKVINRSLKESNYEKKFNYYCNTHSSSIFCPTEYSNAYLFINDPWDPNNPNDELNLYEIFNNTFGQNLTSSDQLVSQYGLADSLDDWWKVANSGGGMVKFTVRYAGFNQELGIQPFNGIYQTLITNIPQGTQNTSVIINSSDKFAFVEKASGNVWYSADTLNPNQDGVDHFNAFDVTGLYNSTFNQNVSQAWLIAFEDYPGGYDHDYDDLVALVIEVQPTLINLSSFTVKANNGRIKLEWITESEIDNVGFNLYRAESESGEFLKINAVLIPANGSSTQGAAYEFTDTNVQNRKTYYYKMEDMDLNGNASIHGPVSATPRWLYGFLK